MHALGLATWSLATQVQPGSSQKLTKHAHSAGEVGLIGGLLLGYCGLVGLICSLRATKPTSVHQGPLADLAHQIVHVGMVFGGLRHSPLMKYFLLLYLICMHIFFKYYPSIFL